MSAPEEKVYNVLMLCTGNSARSIMPKALIHGDGQTTSWEIDQVINARVPRQATEKRLPVESFGVPDMTVTSLRAVHEPVHEGGADTYKLRRAA